MRFSTQAKIGLVTFLAVVILGGILVWKGDIFLKAQGYNLIGSFSNVGGLQEGSDVRYRGYKVGKVAKIVPGVKDTKVYMYITGDVRVPEGSTLRVAFDGLIGQKYLEILPSGSEKTIKPRTELQGYNTLGLVDFIDVGTLNLEELQGILKSVRKITDDPETQKAVKDALINIQASTYQLNKFVTDLNAIMSQKEFKQSMQSLKDATDAFLRVSKKLDSITDSIDKLLSDPEFGRDLKGAAKEAKGAMEELKNAASDVRKTLRKLVRD